jgi:glutamate dehydrogenase
MLTQMEKAGAIVRTLEGLPTDEELAARVDGGLTAPEFAVLLAYVKIRMETEVLADPIVDEPWTASVLSEYFPTPLRARFADRMAGHRLRPEIVTTVLVNEVVNRGGTSFVFRVVEETGATVADAIRAYVVVRDVYGLPDLWKQVEALDNRVSTEAQTVVYLELRRLLDRAVRWIVTNRRSPIDVPAEIARFRPGVQDLLCRMDALFVGSERRALQAHAAEIAERGLPSGLGSQITCVMYGFGLLDIVETSQATGHSLDDVASVYFGLSERFRVDALLSKISLLPREDRWQTLARMALRYDLYAALAALTSEVLTSTSDGVPAADRISQWEQANATSIARTRSGIGEFEESRADLAALSVLLRQIRQLVRTSSAG